MPGSMTDGDPHRVRPPILGNCSDCGELSPLVRTMGHRSLIPYLVCRPCRRRHDMIEARMKRERQTRLFLMALAVAFAIVSAILALSSL